MFKVSVTVFFFLLSDRLIFYNIDVVYERQKGFNIYIVRFIMLSSNVCLFVLMLGGFKFK